MKDVDLPYGRGYFDCIILADVLEHLEDPLSTLRRLRGYLSPKGIVVASIPNVRYYGVINMLVEGRWKYEDSGILDRTHLRFFTRKEMESLFRDAGFEITGICGNLDPAYHSLSDPFSGNISFGRVSLTGLTPEETRDLFVVQYLIKADMAGRVAAEAGSALESGREEEALSTLERHLEMHPGDLDILYSHAVVCWELGLPEKALESLDKILLLSPRRKDAIELRTEIMEGMDAYQHV